jgi:hypothetical protein
MGDRPIARLLPTEDSTTQKDAYIHASSEIRIMIPVFERSKTINLLL